MGSMFSYYVVLLTILLFLLFSHSNSGPIKTNNIEPNFTASFFHYIDTSGIFLVSPDETYTASITNIKSHPNGYYYFTITHSPSSTIIWTANQNKPMSKSDQLSLTTRGISITSTATSKPRLLWSTPVFGNNSLVSSLRLEESGNLVLLDTKNLTLWQSFDNPSDTIVLGQQLPVGKFLVSDVSGFDSSVGSYRFVITETDAVLQWNRLTYWKLSMDANGYQDKTALVSFFAIDSNGFYLFGVNGSTVVMKVNLGYQPFGSFRVAKLGYNGKMVVSTFVNKTWVQEFTSPSEDCDVPFVCKALGLCTTSTAICSCPPNFHPDPRVNGSCTPLDSSLYLPNSTTCGSNYSTSYVKLGYGIDYFANEFMSPIKGGIDLATCQKVCTQNCSCLGVFHDGSSGACYLLESYLGSVMSASNNDNNERVGYIKTIIISPPSPVQISKDRNFPLAGLVLLPTSGFFLLVIVVTLAVMYKKTDNFGTRSRSRSLTLGRSKSYSDDLEIISIPGLPVRFKYEDLAKATENFSTQIGTGGFGTVYKGTLPDKTVVAVKKMNTLGVQGKKEFCTEVAIIGNVHHINLVTLKGFCAQSSQFFLVYEYMNQGSLDRKLFGTEGPVLSWKERFEISLGTARGLAYLHSECEHKIIHCDVKPENILLQDSNSPVKLSDFGLSKLLGPDQSSLFTTLRGTRGYLAPEWLTGSTISNKVDVYSYGMVVLELVRGKKNSYRDENCVYFPLLVLEMHEKRNYLDLLDTRLQGHVKNEDVEKLSLLALCCLHEEPSLRPSMVNVVAMLEGTLPVGEPRIESLNYLRSYGRRFTESSHMGDGDGDLNQIGSRGFRQVNAGIGSRSSSSLNSPSFVSAQPPSGPR